MSEAQSSDPEEAQIRTKRTRTLEGIYDLITKGWDPNYPTILHDTLVASTVEQYLRERRLLKVRDRIPNKIQRHKVAGLMTAAIVSNRPIQVPAPGSPEGVSNSFDNEYFAVIHGLSICAEGYEDGQFDQIFENHHFAEWCENFVHLLRFTTPRSDSLIHIFQTVCMAYFPENLEHDAGSD